MRPARLLAYAALLCVCRGASALQHSVSDFRLDSSATSSDRYRLDPGWGDSLLLLPESFRYTSTRTFLLSDGRYENGDAGASPVAAMTDLYKFKVFYLSWRRR